MALISARGASLPYTAVTSGNGRYDAQALIALAEAAQARVGLAVTGLEIRLAAAADVHFRTRQHRFHAGFAGRPRG